MKRRILLAGLALVCAPAAARDCGEGLKRELLARFEVDQHARKALSATPASGVAQDAALRIDAENTAFMRDVLSTCGWPKRSELGDEAAKAAWLLTQHADMDPEYQVLASRQLKYAVLANEAEPQRLALLVDRNRRLNDQPQVYGTQFFRDSVGPVRFFDIVMPAQLDQRRKGVGLSSFYCWAQKISAMNQRAPVQWPAGVLFQPEECVDAPRQFSQG